MLKVISHIESVKKLFQACQTQRHAQNMKVRQPGPAHKVGCHLQDWSPSPVEKGIAERFLH